jgi:hypothetical protein
MKPYSGMRKIKVDEGARIRRITTRLPANFIEALDQASALLGPSRSPRSRKGHLMDKGRSSKRLRRR